MRERKTSKPAAARRNDAVACRELCAAYPHRNLMSRFAFTTDDASEDFCEEIAKAICDIHGVSEEEAIALINKQWRGASLIGEDELLYHEFPAVWAKFIFRRHNLGAPW